VQFEPLPAVGAGRYLKRRRVSRHHLIELALQPQLNNTTSDEAANLITKQTKPAKESAESL